MNDSTASVRIWVPDVWQVVELPAIPDATVGELKARALERTIGSASRADPSNYVVKYRGALVSDEGQTVSTLNLPDKAPLIVLPARRRPVV